MAPGPFNNDLFHPLEHAGDGTAADDLLALARLTLPHEVTLTNYYKELPVYAPARVLDATGDTLVCRTSGTQSRVISFSGHTIITGEPFRHHVYADALHDQDSGTVVLSGLRYVEVQSNRRAAIRVRMQVPPPVCIEAGGTRINGRLVDLSLDGCAITIADPALLKSYSFFHLTIDMPSQARKAQAVPRVMARLIKAHRHTGPVRCVFQFAHDRNSEDQISMIVVRRQTEIIRELTS